MAMRLEALDQHEIDPSEATNQVFQRRLTFVDFTRRIRGRAVAGRFSGGMIEIDAVTSMPGARDDETANRLARLTR
jgi:hypothetical protein